MPEKKVLTNNKSDVISNYSVTSDDLKINDSIVLEDSALRSMVCEGDGCSRMIIDAVVPNIIQ